MNRPEPILPEEDRAILVEVYEIPDMAYDTFHFTESLYFPKVTNLSAVCSRSV